MTDSKSKLKNFTAEKMAHDFVAIREQRSKLKAEYEAKDEEFKTVQEKIKAHMMDHLNRTGAESVRTSVGTFYKQLEIKPSCQDWEAFYHWIKKEDAFEFLEKRVTRSAVADYVEAHGEPPPGVSVHKEFDIRVRKNT